MAAVTAPLPPPASPIIMSAAAASRLRCPLISGCRNVDVFEHLDRMIQCAGSFTNICSPTQVSKRGLMV